MKVIIGYECINTSLCRITIAIPALFADTAPDDITAACISSDSDSITVAVNYTNGCRRETVVQANGVTCIPLSEAPAMMIFECGVLYPNTSYNITADSNGHSHSDTCSTKQDHYRGMHKGNVQSSHYE